MQTRIMCCSRAFSCSHGDYQKIYRKRNLMSHLNVAGMQLHDLFFQILPRNFIFQVLMNVASYDIKYVAIVLNFQNCSK